MRRIFPAAVLGLLACTGTVSLGNVPVPNDGVAGTPIPDLTTRGYPITCYGVGPNGSITLESQQPFHEGFSYIDPDSNQPTSFAISFAQVATNNMALTITSGTGPLTQTIILDRNVPPVAQLIAETTARAHSLNGGTGTPDLSVECVVEGDAPVLADAATPLGLDCDVRLQGEDGGVTASKHLTFTPADALLDGGADSDDGTLPFVFDGPPSAYQGILVDPRVQLVNHLSDRTVTGEISVPLTNGRTLAYSCYAPPP